MIEDEAMGVFIMKYIFAATCAGDFYSSGSQLDPDFTHSIQTIYNYEQKIPLKANI